MAECGENQDCQTEFNYTLIERGEKYSALNNLIEAQFWVTSINPETETIKVLFFDDDMMLRRMGIKEKLEIETLFIGWIEESVGHFYYYNHDGPEDGSVPGLHHLYTSDYEDVNEIIPWQENEFQMFDPDASGNTSGLLSFSIFAKDNLFNAQGVFDYSNCLNSPDYTFGTECKMYISGDQWVSYFPPREEISLNEPESTTDPIEISAEESSETEPENMEKGTESNEELEPGFGSETASDSEPLTSNLAIPEAPNTGKASCERVIELPWWFLALLGLGDLIALWLFWPTKNHKNPKNLHKRS